MGRFNRTRWIGSKNRPFFQDRDKKSDRRFFEKSVLRFFDLLVFSCHNITKTVLVQMLCISPPNLITHGKLTYKLWNFHVKIVYLPCIMRLEVTFSPRRAHGLAHCRLRFHHLYLKLQNVFLFKIYNTIFSFIFIITILTFIM